MRFLVLIIFFSFLQLFNAQTRFYKLYSGSGFDTGEDILALPDSSYLVAGSSGSWQENAQGFLMKIDSVGNYLWSHSYGEQETEEIKRVFYRPGVGYYLAGMSNSWSEGNYDPMLVLTDLNGNQQWVKTYSHPSWERIHDGVQTIDTGIVLVGERQASFGAEADLLVLRLDKNGDTLWTRSLGSFGADRAKSIIRISDSTYAVGGEWYVADSNATKGFVFLLHDNGQIIWFDTLGHLNGDFVINDLTLTPFGIQFAGFHRFSTENHNVFSGSVALSGQILNQNAPQDGSFQSDDKCQQIAYLTQLNKCIYGIQVQNDSTFSEYYDLNFGYMDALYGFWLGLPYTMVINQGYDYIGNIRPTLDNGFIAVGMNSVIIDGQNQLNGGSNVFVLKVDGNGSAYVQTDTVFSTQQLVGLTPIFEGSNMQVFPNPATSQLNLTWNGVEQKHVTIYSQLGSKVFEAPVNSNQTIDLHDWKNGIYYIRIDQQVFPLLKQ